MSEASLLSGPGDWRKRLEWMLETMRQMSAQTDPQAMVRGYVSRMERVMQLDRLVTLTRCGCTYPEYVVTSDSTETMDVELWEDPQRRPHHTGGLFAELLYAGTPRVIGDLDVPQDDPCTPYVVDCRSLLAIPLFEAGTARNMALFLRKEPHAYIEETLPERVWLSNLFMQATQNLVLSQQLRSAYDEVDQELKAVADMQRALLPAEFPQIPNLELAACYHTARRAGGDYYDFFPLPRGHWGILIADVAGHGTPAAVMMAITHSLVHNYPDPPEPPGRLLMRLNEQLTRVYTHGGGTFVTAFYGIYDPATRRLTYASAGHNPPRLKRCADKSLLVLDDADGLPLGIVAEQTFREAAHDLQAGDQIVFYTDGITEAFNAAGDMFGTARLDDVLARCNEAAGGLIAGILQAVEEFTAGHPADDDRTIVIAKVK